MNMGEPVPLSKEDRTFSFGEDVDLSLSLPSTSVKKSEGKEYKKFSAQPPSADLGGLTSIEEHPKESSKKGDPQVGHYEDISTEVPADNANPSYSRLTFSTLSSRPYAESSNEARDRVTGYDSQQYPSDYEVFLAKSREDYENAQRRNWPTVEIDDASFFRAKRGKEYDKRKKLATFRAALRAVQVFVRYPNHAIWFNVSVIVLALVTLTVSKVRNTSNIAQGSNENLWPQPLVLYPEYIITAISGISFAVSLGSGTDISTLIVVAELCLLFVDRLSETKTKLGLGVNFGLNLIFLVIWVLAIILFKVNSSTQFVWGYACNLAGFQNRLLDYQEICSREVPSNLSYTERRPAHGP